MTRYDFVQKRAREDARSPVELFDTYTTSAQQKC
jgi:hypothetical protein